MALAAKDLNVGDTYTECLVEDLKRTNCHVRRLVG